MMQAVEFKLEYSLCPEERPKVAVIIAAAGSSSRMGGENKMLLPLQGVPVLVHTCRAFQNCPGVDRVILTTRQQDVLTLQQMAETYSLSKITDIVAGGATRTQSVANGFAAVGDADIVLIHDGARPLISQQVIEAVINAVQQQGAAAPVVPVKDTIKVCGPDGQIIHTPDRSTLFAVQTPQGFRSDLYKDALAKAQDKVFTDDCALLEDAGYTVYTVPGDYKNIKITTPEDLLLAQAFLRGE